MPQEGDHVKNEVIMVLPHIQRLHLMYSELALVLVTFERQFQPQIIPDAD